MKRLIEDQHAQYFHFLYVAFLLCTLNSISCLDTPPQPNVCVVDFSDPNAFRPEHRAVLNPAEDFALSPCTRQIPKDIEGYFRLDSDQVCALEQNLWKLDQRLTDCCCCAGCQLTTLQTDVLQYIGVCIDGKTYVYINGFSLPTGLVLDEAYPNWKKEPIYFCDGGNWGVLFDVETASFSKLAMDSRAFGGVSNEC